MLACQLIACHKSNDAMNTRPNWIPEPPEALTVDFYRSHEHLEDADTGMWTYLCELIANDQRPFPERVKEMLRTISPSLKQYYLTRGFDWERRSGGLEACLMHEPDDDSLLLEDTMSAYEALGASKHAAIIRELIPKARERWAQIHEADAQGREFNYDDGLWDPYEERWDAASEEFNFYDVIWKDIQAHPERYTHSKM